MRPALVLILNRVRRVCSADGWLGSRVVNRRKRICRGMVVLSRMQRMPRGPKSSKKTVKKTLSSTASLGEALVEPRARTVFQKRLLAWYDAHQRDLPWRKNRDPYRVWLSEIMLQQTRVAAVIEKYGEFLRLFPNVEALAKASQPAVLAAWSGLGYYRRARALHDAARTIVLDRGSKFPATAEEWQQLPGIGRYTSAAIASISLNEKIAVVDGNVERVAERLLGRRLSAAEVWDLAGQLVSPRRPGDFNQAMMELGATVCVPVEPKCLLCPVATLCVARGNLPSTRRSEKTKKATVFYALDCHEGKVALAQRPKQAAVMPAMWELPEVIPGAASAKVWLRLKHSITNTNYDVHVIRGEAGEVGGERVAVERLSAVALTGLARKILRAAELL
jgi:A/G-specific adenine glycosylase